MYIGKQDDDNNLTGSGIHIDTYGEIIIGQWKNGERAPGMFCMDFLLYKYAFNKNTHPWLLHNNTKG